MIVGGCLCGGVRWELDAAIDEISICHCSMCRKAQGSAYVPVCAVATERLRIVQGSELLKEYRAQPAQRPGKARVFCSHCGSPLYSLRDDLPGVRRLRLGTAETPFTSARAYHKHVASKAAWEPLGDDGLPRYDAEPPPRER